MRFFWVLMMCLSWAGPAGAQSGVARAAARELGTEGVEALQAGRLPEAVDKLERAFNVVRAPSIGLWSARALVKSGKWVEAAERYLEVSRLDPSSGDVNLQRQAQADAAKEREELLAMTPSLRIQVRGASPGAIVSIDGTPLEPALLGAAEPTNPGVHLVELRDGTRRARRRIDARPSRTLAVTLDAGAPGTAEDESSTAVPNALSPGLSGLQVTGIVVGGVGVVGLGLGGFFAIRAKGLDRESKEQGRCDENNVCDANGYAKRGNAVDNATAATISAIAGTALSALGVTLVLVGGKRSHTEQARLRARPASGSAGVELCGSF